MADIRPFLGTRYTAEAGSIDSLVAPPYDVLSPEERDEYASKNPHNIVHLTIPEAKNDDRSKFVKYARSSALLAEWKREGALATESGPVFYRYTQTFRVEGQSFSRTAIIGLIKTEPYEKGVVLPHEQTFPKHKEDRLRILEATRSHLECIFGLFEDDGRKVFDKIASAKVGQRVEVTTEDGVEHVLELIDDPATCNELTLALADKKVWIADGHHRYETACTFRAQLGEQAGLVPEDFMMMALSSMGDPGLVLLPTHRTLSKLPVTEEQLDNVLQTHFNVRKVANSALVTEIEEIGDADTRAFGVALPSGTGLVATIDPKEALDLIDTEGSADLKTLDVTILHGIIFEKLLGINGLETVGYTRDNQEAIESVNNGAAVAFVMNPPTVDDMRRIALGGEKMPQKSTFYYPKILSGLVLWSLSDFIP